MVPPVSDRAPPTPPYSGYGLGWRGFRVRGCHPLWRAFPGAFRYPRFFHVARPATPRAPRRPRFGLAPFRSPLLGGSLLFSFPPATWMFRFAGLASAQWRMPRLPRGGLPHSGARGSPAARASPRPFAACRALRRPWEPMASPVRPCSLARRRASRPAALCAYIILPLPWCGTPSGAPALVYLAGVTLVRTPAVSLCVLLSFLSPILSMNRRGHSVPAVVENVGLEPTTPGLQSRCSSQLSQSPRIVVPGRLELPAPTLSVWCSNRLSYGTPSTAPKRAGIPRRSLLGRHKKRDGPPRATRERPRKEVFQPHLPVRLPCYDLAPVTTFALGGSSPTSGARGSHGLTGGVYKARERIHRAMADARLLANPTSRSRVADSDPN